MKKAVVIFFLGVIVGGGASYYLHIKPDQNNKNSEVSFKDAAKMYSEELNDYVKLKSAEEKLRKADELLGKVMTLFLANVAIHFDSRVTGYFEKPTSKRLETSVDNSEREEKGDIKTAHEIPAEKEDKVEMGPYTSIDVPLHTIKNEDFRAPYVRSRFKVISSPFQYFKSAKLSQSKQVGDEFSGDFTGQINVLKGSDKGKFYDVVLNINFQVAGENLSGSFFSEISKDGKPFSTNRGKGGNNHLRQAQDKNEYLISTSPASYMQLFKLNDNQYYGSYYDNDEYIGIIILDRN